MELSEYQSKSRKTAIYPNVGDDIVYPTLGLAGEAGEVADKIKKIIRDNGGTVTDEHRHDIEKELGDVLWYIAQLSTELGLDLNNVAQQNLNKLVSRKERGVLGGSGDER